MGDGSRLEAGRVRSRVPCEFDSRSFRCGRVRCWFPETDCESVRRRFNSDRPPNHTFGSDGRGVCVLKATLSAACTVNEKGQVRWLLLYLIDQRWC